ncbi:copper homeostasis protein CutC [Gallibacterium genomosp. 3]|uniref:PF03932 family protein CutC n=1 Tax=Gallibacterium genomosp. 3 TaxID=505345 RepID=A0A1A7PQ76_9PAST|nr:copper homeostasis protein CutC [Gallibacterium genomosp. 3]OBX03867.1 copper homeostasis protein CutC [Gallibacterium genomosp. 3]
MKIEVCVDNLESALIAESAGADRIELCAALPLGGITPSYALIKTVIEQLTIPVHVMIRPRAGDFLFTPQEQQIMLTDIEIAKQLGAPSVVIGALTEQAQIDLILVKRLIQSAKGMGITFHRAFDLCSDPYLALQQLIDLGCQRVLTSGLATTAEQGIHCLANLVHQANHQITIMAGAGITANNADKIAQQTGITELHLSGKSYHPSKMQSEHIQAIMGQDANTDTQLLVTDFNKIATVRRLFPI